MKFCKLDQLRRVKKILEPKQKLLNIENVVFDCNSAAVCLTCAKFCEDAKSDHNNVNNFKMADGNVTDADCRCYNQLFGAGAYRLDE